MVVAAREEARHEQEVVLRKNEQLKAQLADTEALLKSHQEQLAELKQVMEHMSQIDEHSNVTAPSTPGMARFDDDVLTPDADAPLATVLEPASPSHPTSFSHLLQPVLRTDLGSFEDFRTLLHLSKKTSAHTRNSSGSIHKGLGLNLSVYADRISAATHAHVTTHAQGATPAATPTTPTSTGASTTHPPVLLKDTKFYKRALVEDIEPTLRLDIAPGLSWLARRTVLTAVYEGSLMVEPMPMTLRKFNIPCALCGEMKKDKESARTHRFRTSENENAQRYPLCTYCLGRVRSTCDYLSFLRVIKDGHWRAEDEEAEKSAWEESVRLREVMFWRRIGGGVVPAESKSANHRDSLRSPRLSDVERLARERQLSEEVTHPRDVTVLLTPPMSAKEPVEDDVPPIEPKKDAVSSGEAGEEEADSSIEVSSKHEQGQATVEMPIEHDDTDAPQRQSVASLEIPGQDNQSTGDDVQARKRLSLEIPSPRS